MNGLRRNDVAVITTAGTIIFLEIKRIGLFLIDSGYERNKHQGFIQMVQGAGGGIGGPCRTENTI
jgi:hypothetical protein